MKILLVNLLQKNFLKSLKKKTLDGHFSATAATAVEEVFHLIMTILHDSMKSQEKLFPCFSAMALSSERDQRTRSQKFENQRDGVI